MQETRVQSLGQEDPLEKETATPPVFLPGEFHEQRSLAGYSPWNPKELDMTEQLTSFLSFFLRDISAIPGLGRSLEGGQGSTEVPGGLQRCLVGCRVSKSWTQLK